MPVGKPTPDGDIVMGSRHYKGRTLGATTVWNCPACGVKNEGRPQEQGCAHCGSGDPTKSRAGHAQAEPPVSTSNAGEGHRTRPATDMPRLPESPRPSVPAVAPARILRLIEYLIKPGENVDITLRRSLVGRMDYSWGTLTGTIVDSCDERQEDLLRLARKQPGVWVANETAMELARKQDAHPQPSLHELLRKIPPYTRDVITVRDPVFNPFADAAREREDRMDMPDTGPEFTPPDAAFARMIADEYGLKLVYTLGLALSQIAPELEANMEPEKFLSADECLRLANALMAQIPADWAGDVPPSAPEDTQPHP